MSVIRISRPKRDWSVSIATVLPTALLVRLFGLHWNFTVVLDDHSAGKLGNEQVRVFHVDPGEHRLRMRFVLLRRSKEMRMSLKEGEEREFVCGSNGFGWPTRRRRRLRISLRFGDRPSASRRSQGIPFRRTSAECRFRLITITRRPRQPRTDDREGPWRGP